MKSFCLTDVGRKRTLNEDFVYASDRPVGSLPSLYIVADGMGGYKAGEVASRMAVETVVETVENTPAKRPTTILEHSVMAANEQIMQKALADKNMEGMGTTLVVCTVMDHCLYVANVGDSRLYVLSDVCRQVTRDHSLVEEMIRAGQISRQEARTHEKKNIITRAVGVTAGMQADYFDIALVPGDTALLCSDGLTNMVTDEEIFRIVKEASSLEEAGRALVQAANDNGGSDNISVVLLREDEGGV